MNYMYMNIILIVDNHDIISMKVYQLDTNAPAVSFMIIMRDDITNKMFIIMYIHYLIFILCLDRGGGNKSLLLKITH